MSEEEKAESERKAKVTAILAAIGLPLILLADVILDEMGSKIRVVYVGGLLVLAFLLVFVAVEIPGTRRLIRGLLLFVLLAGGAYIIETQLLTMPLRIVISQVSNYYPWPEGGKVTQLTQAQELWVSAKYVPDLLQGPGNVLLVGLLASALVFGLPKLFKKNIPVEFFFLIAWGAASYWLIVSPLNFGSVDPKTAEAMNRLWWIGATQSIVWGLITTGIPLLLNLFGQGFQKLGQIVRSTIPMLIFASLTWAGTSLLFTIFEPGILIWSYAMSEVHTTALTATIAMQCVESGRVAFFCVNGAFVSAVTLLLQFFGITTETED